MRSFNRAAALMTFVTLLPASLSATWSVIAIDTHTGQIVIASATCVTQESLRGFPADGLMDIQAIIVPGLGVAAAQAGVDRSRSNQTLIYQELKAGSPPRIILDLLRADPDIQRRQFAIVDAQGRSIGFSGTQNGVASLSYQGQAPGTQIFYSVQGNTLASDEVVYSAAEALEQAEGNMLDKVMAAMEAADAKGGDRRCTCETRPLPDAPCDGKNAHVAYLLAANTDDPEGNSFNDGNYLVFLNVTDENIQPNENANPVIALRMRYDAWKAQRR